MPSTYSSSLKLELIQNNEQSGIWGQTTNKNFSLLEQAISGVLPLTLTGDYTLSSLDGIIDEARNAVINCSGLLGAPANVIAPSVQKTYIITNNTGANVTIKTSTGNGVTVLNTTSALVYCDGTDFYSAVTINNVIGDQTISGNEVILGNVTSSGNLTVTSNVSSGAGNLTFTSNNGIVTAAVNTGAYTPPTGTSAQRPLGPNGGMSRFNTDIGAYEIFNGAVWQPITGAYSVNFLLVAGGGGGGYGPFTFGGGGGAGGMLANVSSVQPGTTYSIVIGAGGSGANGVNSTALGFTAIGGGQGSTGALGSNGGSGGGGDPYNNGGSGTAGQGFAGVRGAVLIDGQTAIGGGGGGAGAVGGGTAGYVADGGAGNVSTITGASVYYAGGGGGAGEGSGTVARGGFGGIGGGGAGAGGVPGGSPTLAVAGTANTGGGGGAGGSSAGGAAAGGSGVCILSYPSATQRATGGNVTTYTSGGQVYWVHTFTTSGTFSA